MTAIDQLLGEFVNAWNTGQNPDVHDYVARASPDERRELEDQLAAWIEFAPLPAYDDRTLASMAQDPKFVAAVAKADLLRTPLAERIPTLRERAGLAVRDVAARLSEAFTLDPARTEEYVAALEAGEFDERRLSQRLLDKLAGILGVDADALTPSPAAGGQAFFRADEDADLDFAEDLQVLSRAALSPAPEAPMDELDRLFRGGPGA